MSQNYKPLYYDTDSAWTPVKTNRDYISVIVDNKPTVIFKCNIVAITKIGVDTEIICVGDVNFYTKEDYASVVKKIIG